MPENQTETPFWKSKTVIGSVVAVVCGILSFCGIDISADTQSVIDRKSTRLNSSHDRQSRMPSSA